MEEHKPFHQSSWLEDAKAYVPVTIITTILFSLARTNPEAHIVVRFLAGGLFVFACFFGIAVLMWVLHGMPIRRLATLETPLSGVLRLGILGALSAFLFSATCVVLVIVFQIPSTP